MPAAAAGLTGTHEGRWVNTTFGSAGDARAVAALEGSTLVLTIDLDGNVFGNPDPPEETFRIPLDGSGIASINSRAFGQVTISLVGPRITVEMSDVPGPRVDRAVSRGTISDGTVAMRTTIYFSDGSTASGTLDMERK